MDRFVLKENKHDKWGERTLCGDIKIEIQTFSEETSFHGVKYICGRNLKLMRRCVWFLSVFTLIISLLYLLSSSLQKYYRYESSVSMSVNIAENLTFPSITFCSDALTVNQNSVKYHYNDSIARVIEKEYLNAVYLRTLNETTMSSEMLQFMKSSIAFDTFYKIRNQSITKCVIPNMPVCENVISPTYIHHLDELCQTFLSHDFITRNGLASAVKANQEHSLVLKIATKGMQYGIAVQVHHPYVTPDILTNNYKLSPGTLAYMGLDAVTTQHLGSPYSKVNCLTDSEAKLHINDTLPNKPYTDVNCLSKCVEDLWFNTCNCTINTYGSWCTLYEYYKCKPLINFDLCKACAPKCDSISYNVRLSTMSYGEPDTIAIVVSFSTMKYTITRQIPSLEFEQLFSNFGGLIGLFIGGSILSFFECIDLFFKILFKKLSAVGRL